MHMLTSNIYVYILIIFIFHIRIDNNFKLFSSYLDIVEGKNQNRKSTLPKFVFCYTYVQLASCLVVA